VTVAGQFFNSASSTGTATISPSLGTAGPASGTVTLVTTGEGLSNESPVNVGVHYMAQVFTGKMAWKPAAGSGNWSADANWTDTQSAATAGAPGLAGTLSAGDTAAFDNATAPTTVTLLNASPRVAAITFSGLNAYTIAQGAGGGTLHLDNGAAVASITAASDGHQISAPLVFDSAATIEVTHPDETLSFSAAVTNVRSMTKSGSGTLQITGSTHFAQDTTIAVSGGALRLNVAAGSTVGAGVVANVASAATLDLAGSVSALAVDGPSPGSRPVIQNDGMLSVTALGSAQVVGGIDGGAAGTGVTSVGAGTSLMADHIIQAALIIGGDQDFGGLVTISPSDELGNPLVAYSPASSFLSASSTVDPGVAGFGFDGTAGNALARESLGDTALAGNSSVPEPTSQRLLLVGAFLVATAGRIWRRRP
jgi:hypothetical protein